VINLILAELQTPDGQIGPLHGAYRRAATGVWHAVLGAALCAHLGLWGVGFAFLLAVAYWLVKERRDYARGGAVWDGLEDAVMVSLGAWYGPVWWPAMICAAGVYIMASAAWRRG